MLISHEVPICLLNKSKKFNDYDYCLLHLLFENEDYCKYYINASNEGRNVLLDNSVFELGESLTNDLIFKGVELINPDWVVAPDVLDDCDKTITNFRQFKLDFNKKFPNSDTQIIGVIQGKTLDDLISCYEFMASFADKIAIPFHSKAYINFGDNNFEGRIIFINTLKKFKIWNHNKPHHLLGCYKAIEFSMYNFDYLNIESLDTSNPIIAGIKGFRYGNEGLRFKPDGKLCDLINTSLNFKQKRDIMYNIKKFKQIVNSRNI